jgi:hypothetical protein
MTLRRWSTIGLLLGAFALIGAALHRPAPSGKEQSPRDQIAGPKPGRAPVASAIASTGARRVASGPARQIDPFGNPIVGEPHVEISPTGAVLWGAELVPGHEDALPVASLPTGSGAPEAVVRRSPDEPPPGHSRLDPTQYGYKTASEMEHAVRRGLRVPDGYRVVLWAQERNGRQGVAIQIVPPEEVARARAAGEAP